MSVWLTVPTAMGEKNTHILARCSLSLTNAKYIFKISARERYRLWINEKYCGFGPVPSYPSYAYYDSYELIGGNITIAVHIYSSGLTNRVICTDDVKLCVSLECNGEEIKDFAEKWKYEICKAYSGHIVGYNTAFTEDFDSRLWHEGWEKNNFNDSEWNYFAKEDSDIILCERPIKYLCESKIYPRLKRKRDNRILLDFGKEISGILCAKANGNENESVIIRSGEELNDDGSVRYNMRCGCVYEELWTLKNGSNLLHQFDYKAFRYVELIIPRNSEITDVYAQTINYPIDEELCTLHCKSKQLEDIFRICKNAVKCCTIDGYLDCATREKGQYLGDAIITSRSQIWISGSTEMLRKCIRDFIYSAKISPPMLSVAPCSFHQKIADFTLLFPILPLCDYEFTADSNFLRECYPTVTGIIEYFKKYCRNDGLLENVTELWNLVDWPEDMRDNYDFNLPQPIVGKGCHNVVNALWVGANIMRERIEKILSLPRHDCSEKLKEAFISAFFRPEYGLFTDSTTSSHCSLHSNIYPAFFGFMPSKSIDIFAREMTSDSRYCGVFPMYFAIRALSNAGKHNEVWQLISRNNAYSWRNMLSENASACFESWGKKQKWNTSLCHPWASSPISIIIEDIAGFKPCPNLPEGFRLEPHIPNEILNFELLVPFRETVYKVEKSMGKSPKTERIKSYAIPEND